MRDDVALAAAIADADIAEVAWKPSGLLFGGYVRLVTREGERMVFHFRRRQQARIRRSLEALDVPICSVRPFIP